METRTRELISSSSSPYFTRSNLAVVLGANRRALDYRIRSLVKEGMILPIKPGFYLNYTLYKGTQTPGDLVKYVGCQAVDNSYVSLEYALAEYGILAENVYVVTYVTTKKTRTFQSGPTNKSEISLRYRNIKQDLFWGYTEKRYKGFSYLMATPAKALFDLIYLTPMANNGEMKEFLFGSRFNWEALTDSDREELKQTIRKSKSFKMEKAAKYL